MIDWGLVVLAVTLAYEFFPKKAGLGGSIKKNKKYEQIF
jgi:hypothetical protein